MERLTKKSILSSYKNVVKVGYCELQNLLTFAHKIGYTAGEYGWSADVFQINLRTAIVTGYRPFGNIGASRELCEKFDKKASELKKSILNYENLKTALDELLQEFACELEVKKSGIN